MYQLAYPGTVPISVWCTNQRTLVQPCQNDPRRQNMPINVPWYKNTVIYTVVVFFLVVRAWNEAYHNVLYIHILIFLPRGRGSSLAHQH